MYRVGVKVWVGVRKLGVWEGLGVEFASYSVVLWAWRVCGRVCVYVVCVCVFMCVCVAAAGWLQAAPHPSTPKPQHHHVQTQTPQPPQLPNATPDLYPHPLHWLAGATGSNSGETATCLIQKKKAS